MVEELLVHSITNPLSGLIASGLTISFQFWGEQNQSLFGRRRCAGKALLEMIIVELNAGQKRITLSGQEEDGAQEKHFLRSAKYGISWNVQTRLTIYASSIDR